MNVDYPGAIPMWVPENDLFTTNTHQAIVIHKTANGTTAQEIGQYFLNVSPGPSVHYIVGLDGTIVQSAPEAMGAGGNCCLEQGHDPFWDQFGTINLNTVTLSIEHVDPSPTNSTPCPQAQIDASFQLVRSLAHKYHIVPDHIKPHSSLDPMSRAHCPGNYPFTDLINYVKQGGLMIPANWVDDGTTLRSPNGYKVVLGFRDYVLSHNWDSTNVPLEDEVGMQHLEASDPALGGGTRQTFAWTMLEWTADRGVFVAHVGKELLYTRNQYTQIYAAYQSLKAQVQPAPSPPAPDPRIVVYQNRLSAAGLQLHTIAQDVQALETYIASPVGQ